MLKSLMLSVTFMSKEIFEPRKIGQKFEIHEISASNRRDSYFCKSSYNYIGKYNSANEQRETSEIIRKIYENMNLKKINPVIVSEDLKTKSDEQNKYLIEKHGMEPNSHHYKIKIGNDSLEIVTYAEGLITAEVESKSISGARKILREFERSLSNI